MAGMQNTDVAAIRDAGGEATFVAADLNDPTSPVAQAIDGTANAITAALSSVTGNQPSAVSNSPVIAALAKKMGA